MLPDINNIFVKMNSTPLSLEEKGELKGDEFVIT
jgi:hypothetical protein